MHDEVFKGPTHSFILQPEQSVQNGCFLPKCRGPSFWLGAVHFVARVRPNAFIRLHRPEVIELLHLHLEVESELNMRYTVESPKNNIFEAVVRIPFDLKTSRQSILTLAFVFFLVISGIQVQEFEKATFLLDGDTVFESEF